jgi:hypothetical protein
MRDLGGQLRLAGDSDQLVERFEGVVFFVSNMADIKAAVAGRRPRDRDHLFRRGVVSGIVLQPRRQPERARFHLGLHEGRHLRDLLRGRGSLVVLAEHGMANRSVPDKACDIQRDLFLPDIRKPRGERQMRAAVLPDNRRS